MHSWGRRSFLYSARTCSRILHRNVLVPMWTFSYRPAADSRTAFGGTSRWVHLRAPHGGFAHVIPI